MGHLYLLGIVINLIIGASVIVYFSQIARSFPYPFLKSMVWHLILFNSALIILLLFEYLEVNVPGFAGSGQNAFYHDLGYFTVCCLLNGIVFVMAKIMTAFLEIRFRSIFVFGLFTGFILIILSYILKEVFIDHTFLKTLTDGIFYNLQLLFFCAEVLLLSILMIRGRNRIREWRQLIYAFVLINLSHYLVLAIVIIFPYSVLIVLAYLYFNLSPLFWLTVFFLKFARNLAIQAESSGILEMISTKYQISHREQDIVRLILMGRSNNEIKDELFISYHTVKNHLYSLYGKLNVRSRYELILLFSSYFQNNADKLNSN